MKNMNTMTLLAAGTCAMIAAGAANAAISITSMGSYTQDFAGFGASSSASMPTDWATTTTSFQGFTNNGTSITIQNATSGASITTGGIFGWGYSSGSPAVIGNSTLAFQGSGSVTSSAVTVSFTNNTGYNISDLFLGFDVYQWRQQTGRASTLTLSSSGVSGLNAYTFTSAAAASGTAGRAFNSTGPAAVPSGFAANGSFSQSLTSLTIANGASFSFTFTYSRGTGSGSAQGIALDNFALTYAPAPGAIALLGVAGLVGSRRRR
jgi:hypothetical protein